MGSNQDWNKEDSKTEVPPEEDDQVTAYIEKSVAQLGSENDHRTALVDEKKKELDVLIAEKYTTLNDLTHVTNSQNLVDDIHFLHTKNAKILESLNQAVTAKRNVSQAYDDHCKKALKVKAEIQQQTKCFDEFTVMNYHDLKKTILNTKKETQEIRAKTALKTEELKKKREFVNTTQKSMANDIRVLGQIEHDLM
uniref:Corona n=1 Tax=Drosophila melanogaster TaxID=7227 RepID=B6UWA1_DROME|nr:corona [Drosophila melanogaster]ACI96883.1 corona [Drosophila melanogaster]